MTDLSKLSFWELNKILYQYQIEYLKRIWWVFVLIVIVGITFNVYTVIKDKENKKKS